MFAKAVNLNCPIESLMELPYFYRWRKVHSHLFRNSLRPLIYVITNKNTPYVVFLSIYAINQSYLIIISNLVVLEAPSTIRYRNKEGDMRHVMGSRVNEVNMGHPPRRPLPHDVTGRWRIGAELDPQSTASVQFQLSTSYLNTVLELRIGSEIEITK